jgi:hypothetical protein
VRAFDNPTLAEHSREDAGAFVPGLGAAEPGLLARPSAPTRPTPIPMHPTRAPETPDKAFRLAEALARRDADALARELAGERSLSRASRAWREAGGAHPFLHELALSGWREGMDSALLGGGGKALEERDEMGRTPLLAACGAGEAQMAWALAGAGASLAARDALGWGPLHWLAAGASAHPVPLASWLAKNAESPWERDALGLSAPFLADEPALLAFFRARAWADGMDWESLESAQGEPLEAVWGALARQNALRWAAVSARSASPNARAGGALALFARRARELPFGGENRSEERLGGARESARLGRLAEARSRLPAARGSASAAEKAEKAAPPR